MKKETMKRVFKVRVRTNETSAELRDRTSVFYDSEDDCVDPRIVELHSQFVSGELIEYEYLIGLARLDSWCAEQYLRCVNIGLYVG